jgi:uncharacterized protein involved in tolerance to divalent cations
MCPSKKLPKKRSEEVRQEVEQIHPYETPCILRIEVDPNEE